MFSANPGPGPGDSKKIQPRPGPGPGLWNKSSPGPGPGRVKKTGAGVQKITLNRKNSLTARSKEPEGTSIESFHYIISQLSQKVEVLIKQGLLNSSVYGNVFLSHQRGDK